jgi:hypothetical protein
MVEENVSGDSVKFGTRILEITDDLGLRAEGAFWLFDGEKKAWRFHLVTSLLDEAGPRFIFARLNLALPKILSEEKRGSLEIYLTSPRSTLAVEIRKRVGKLDGDWGVTQPAAIDLSSNGVHALVYRMLAPEPPKSVKWTRQRFRRKTRELMVA